MLACGPAGCLSAQSTSSHNHKQKHIRTAFPIRRNLYRAPRSPGAAQAPPRAGRYVTSRRSARERDAPKRSNAERDPLLKWCG